MDKSIDLPALLGLNVLPTTETHLEGRNDVDLERNEGRQTVGIDGAMSDDNNGGGFCFLVKEVSEWLEGTCNNAVMQEERSLADACYPCRRLQL
jgi:phage terminase large subunit-like protein